MNIYTKLLAVASFGILSACSKPNYTGEYVIAHSNCMPFTEESLDGKKIRPSDLTSPFITIKEIETDSGKVYEVDYNKINDFEFEPVPMSDDGVLSLYSEIPMKPFKLIFESDIELIVKDGIQAAKVTKMTIENTLISKGNPRDLIVDMAKGTQYKDEKSDSACFIKKQTEA